jgi:hypothetical protein
LQQKFPGFNRSKSDMPIKGDDNSLPVELRPRAKFTLSHELPKPIGGNKLTESMVPGYTGYIPSRKFHFSDTYKTECDQCIDDFMSAKENKSKNSRSLIQTVRGYESHKSIAPEGEVKYNLDHYRDHHPNEIYLTSIY